jgi:ubiquinone/menaquinone biosynthesis C-methylase UbiE
MSSPGSQHNPRSLLANESSGVQENVNTHFDATASYWDAVYRGSDLQGIVYQQRQAAVLEYVDASNLGAGARVLEIGCGAGHLTVRLAERELAVDAIDASPGMVERAARQVREAGYDQRVSVAEADVHALPYESGYFDLVVAVGVIPWLHSPADAVAEMARVLRPGGELILTADNGARLMSFTDPRGMLALTPLRRMYHSLRRRPQEAVSYLHFPARVNRFVRRAGLQVRSGRTVGFGPLTILGRPLFTDAKGVRVNDRLQAAADSGAPGLKWMGWHYLVRAAKPEAPAPL